MNPFARGFSEGIRPIKDISVSEYAEEYAYLPSNNSDSGKFSLSRAPFQKEIMDALTSNNGVNEVVFQAGAQIGKSFISVLWQGYIMQIDPQNIIVYQPTQTLSDTYSESKVTAFIDSTPTLSKIFKNGKNNIKSKKFKGCSAEYRGAQSSNNFRMMSAPYIFADEIDSYDFDIDGEGSPLKLLKARTSTFGRKAKIFYCSTPTLDGLSAIENKFKEGDQNYFHVPCPHCNAFQTLKWEQLKFEYVHLEYGRKLTQGSVFYECEICKKEIKESSKTKMLLNGKWIAENPDAQKNIKSFQISGLYAPIGWFGWDMMAQEWLDAVDDPNAIKAFKNTRLGITYFEKSEQPNHHKLMTRAEDYDLYTVNNKAIVLYAGVDTQDNRLAISVIAFGEGMEAWTVLYEEIQGSPADPDTWAKLNTFLRRTYTHDSGLELKISKAAIDSGGHFTSYVYNFCRVNQDICYAIKGANTDIGHYMKESQKIDCDPITKKQYANAISLYLVNTQLIKKYLYVSLNQMLATDKLDGEKVIHFSKQLQQIFYEMLTAEKLIKKMKNGKMTEEFIKPKSSTRNEALDTFVYAYALAFANATQNFVGVQYKKAWDLIIGAKVIKKEEAKKEPVKKQSKKGDWINKGGFSIK